MTYIVSDDAYFILGCENIMKYFLRSVAFFNFSDFTSIKNTVKDGELLLMEFDSIARWMEVNNWFRALDVVIIVISDVTCFDYEKATNFISKRMRIAYFIKALDKLNSSIKNNNKITEREKEIAILLLKGISVKDVSLRLGTSKKNIYTHRGNVLYKLGLTTKANSLYKALFLQTCSFKF